MARCSSALSIAVIAMLCNLGWRDGHIQAANGPAAQENEQMRELRAHLRMLNADLRQLKTIVETLQQEAQRNQAGLDEETVIGKWVGGHQSLVLSFERDHEFEITGNPPTGPARGRGTWKLRDDGQVVAKYNNDGNPDWANTELPLTYSTVESLEFAGISYHRLSCDNVPRE